ncbi:MAG: hypothetical protein AAGJ80_14910 [Cyanobacteria bacterium J06553_1]
MTTRASPDYEGLLAHGAAFAHNSSATTVELVYDVGFDGVYLRQVVYEQRTV